MDSPQPDDASAVPAKGNALERIRKYVSENPLKFVSTSILLWGLGLLLIFFLRIQYMPEVNLESVSSVLYAVAVLGLVISAYTMLALVAPGMALASVKDSFGRYAKPHLVCISISAALIWVLQLLQQFDVSTFSLLGNILISFGIGLVFPGIAVLYSRKIRSSWVHAAPAPAHAWSPQVNFFTAYWMSVVVTAFIFGVLMLSLMFIVIIGMGGDIRTASNELAVLQLVLLVLLIVGSALAIGLSQSSDRVKIAFFVAPTLLFIILVVTGSFSSIPAMAMKALGQGEISNARIAVTGSTCREINQTLGQRVCAEAEEDDIVAICPVMIKSRIGSQVVLDFAPVGIEAAPSKEIHWTTTRNKTDENRGQSISRRVILDKTKMLSWQPLQSIPANNVVDTSETAPKMATSFDFDAELAPQAKPALARVHAVLADRCGAYFAPLAPDEKASEGKEREKKP